MLQRLKSIRTIDAIIAGMAVLVLVLAVAIGVSVFQQRRQVVTTTPVARAIDDLIARVRKDPNNVELRMNLAQSLSMAGRDREAIKQYEAILKVKKSYAPALSGLGFIALKSQDWETGERYYRRIVELREGEVDPDRDAVLETSYFYLGTALMEQEQYEEAASNFMKALRIRRDASDTHYALAVCFREIDNPKKYKSSLENAMLFDPKMPEANYDYALLIIGEGDLAAGAEHLRIAADAAPKYERPPKALEQFGNAEDRFAKARSLASTDVKRALIEIRIAAALDPSEEKLLFLASLYEKDNNKELAEQVYRMVLELDPLDKDAKSGLERVSK